MHTHVAKETAKQSAAPLVRAAQAEQCAVDAEQRIERTPPLSFDFRGISIFASGAGSAANDAPTLPIQRKLLVGSTHDPLESEADRTTEQVMRSPEAATPLRPESGVAAPGMPAAPTVVHQALHGPGAPLDEETRRFFEPRFFGFDFSRVRVHSGPVAAESAEAVDARAYTVGQNIVFGAGQFAPRTQSGQRLLAHELAHTVQQRRGADTVLRRDDKTGNAVPKLPPLEPIAQRIARLVVGPNQLKDVAEHGDSAGPLISVVRDIQTRRIYVGINVKGPKQSALVQERIADQIRRVASGEVVVVHTVEPGEHSEVYALDRAIVDRQKLPGGRPVTDADMDSFELHNVWLRGIEAGTSAVRCEHCAHITRGVKVTNSLYIAEANAAGSLSGEINNDTVLPEGPNAPKGQGGKGGGGDGDKGGGAGPGAAPSSAGKTGMPGGTPSMGGATARRAATEILKPGAMDKLEFAAKTIQWYLEVKKFADILQTIAKSISMSLATLEHGSPYYKALREGNDFASRAKALDDEYAAVDLRGKAPHQGDPEWDGWSDLQQVQMNWYLAEAKLSDALESISESRKNLRKQMSALRDQLEEKKESVNFAFTSLPWAEVWLFGEAARQIGKNLEDADLSLQSAYNQVALQRGYARVGIQIMEIRLRELGVEGLVGLDIETKDLKKADLSNFTIRK